MTFCLARISRATREAGGCSGQLLCQSHRKEKKTQAAQLRVFPFSLIVFLVALFAMVVFRMAINSLSRHCNNSNSNGKDIRIYHLYGLTAKNALRRPVESRKWVAVRVELLHASPNPQSQTMLYALLVLSLLLWLIAPPPPSLSWFSLFPSHIFAHLPLSHFTQGNSTAFILLSKVNRTRSINYECQINSR